MRSSERISRTPAQYATYQDAERALIARELRVALQSADQRREPWYEWLLARSERRHEHQLQDAEGRPVACPYPGCAAVSASKDSAPQLAPSSAIAEQENAPQLELIA